MTKKSIPEVELYSDWGANPNPGKWGYWIILRCKWVSKEFSAGYKLTTNNRMELTWVITWLSKLKTKSKVKVYTDSQYTINWIEKWWANIWKKNNWYRTKTKKAVNYDLWEQLLELLENHDVTFEWVKWHNWHTENERCDELATEAMEVNNLIEDKGYIPENINEQKSLDSLENHENKEEIIKVLSNWKWDKNLKVEKKWDPCKKCFTPVVKKKPKHTKKTLEKKYYYEYYLSCPNCKTNYMIEAAKRDIDSLKI